MKKLILLFLCLLSADIWAQNPTIDSLLSAEKGANDKTKIEIYNNLAKQYFAIDQLKAMSYVNNAVLLSNKTKDFSKLSTSYNVLATLYFSQNKLLDANKYFEKCRKYAKMFNNESDEWKSLNNQITIYVNGVSKFQPPVKVLYGDFIKLSLKRKEYDMLSQAVINLISKEYVMNDTAISSKEILNRLEQEIAPDFKPSYYNILAYYYRILNKPFNTIAVLRPVIEASKNKSDYNTYVCIMILAETYQYLMRFNESIYWYKDALIIAKKSDNIIVKNNIPNIYSALGNNYMSLKKYDLAMQYIKLSEQTIGGSEKLNNCSGVNCLNLANIYMIQNQNDSALFYLDKAYGLNARFHFNNINILANTLKVKLLMKQKKIDELKVLVPHMEKDLTMVDSGYDTYESYKVLCSYYQSVGNTEKLLFYKDKMIELNDMLKNKEVANLLNETQVKYETEKKDSQIKEQQHAINNRNTIIAISLVLVILTVVLLILIVLYQRKKTKLENINRQKLENELQLNTLRSKVIPHFTKNVLSAIGHFAMNDKLKAGHYIAVFSRFTQMTLLNADRNHVSLQNEIAYLEAYLALEQMRFGNRFEFSIRVDEEVDAQLLIPSMTLHTYCDNAIRHGLVNNPVKGVLNVSVERQSDGVRIVVTDNGIGRQRAAELGTRGTGQGLSLIQSQIDFYNQVNRRPIEQTITDMLADDGSATGTLVVLFVPDGYSFQN